MLPSESEGKLSMDCVSDTVSDIDRGSSPPAEFVLPCVK